MRADIGPRSVNDEQRTVDLILTTTTGVRRRDFWTGEEWVEVLSMDPAHVRLSRINAGAPLLDSHNAYSTADILGTVVPGSVSLTKKAMLGTVRFSKRDAVEEIWKDVKDGIIRDVSIGYRIYKFTEEARGKENSLPIRTAIDWEPFETSLVPIPADAGAKVRGAEPTDANECLIVTRAEEPEAPAQPEPPKEVPKKEQNAMLHEPSETIIENPTRTAAVPPSVAEPNERDAGVAAERARCTAITAGCRNARLPQSFADGLIREGVPLVEAQTRILAEVGKRDDPNGAPRPGAVRAEVIVGDDPFVHVRAGISNALLHRVASERHKLEEVGQAYRGMSILDIGKVFLGARGVRVTSMSRSDLVDAMMGRGGMHSTSDFPSLLEDVAKKNLRSAYEAAPQTWLPIAQPINLSDFKPSRQLQIGDAPGLDEILEHGEVTTGTITEAKETVQLKTYGKAFAITRQALINDDLNAFGQVPALFGRKARDKESDLAWAQITSNPTMGDAVALFDAAGHLNYTASGTAISVDSLGVGRAALRKQKGIDGVTPLNLSPRFLISPAGKETIADQYVTQITPAASSNVNPFGPSGRTPLIVIVEPRLDANSATAWYLACSADQAPVLYYGTLDGQSGPDLRQEEGFDIDGMKFRCRIDVAFKAADWHAIYKNVGA